MILFSTMFDIENQEQVDRKPGETGGVIIMIITSLISIIYGVLLIIHEKDYVWRPHRVIQGVVAICCVCMLVMVPLGGMLEVCITNKGTLKEGAKNSFISAVCCICHIF